MELLAIIIFILFGIIFLSVCILVSEYLLQWYRREKLGEDTSIIEDPNVSQQNMIGEIDLS